MPHLLVIRSVSPTFFLKSILDLYDIIIISNREHGKRFSMPKEIYWTCGNVYFIDMMKIQIYDSLSHFWTVFLKINHYYVCFEMSSLTSDLVTEILISFIHVM